MSKDVKRLYSEFKPEHYALSLTPDRDQKTFSGSVTITGRKTGRPNQRLTFHQNGLKITGASIVKHDKKGDQEIEVDRINTQDKFDEVRLHAKQMLYPGKYTITLEFKGKITRPMNGMYPCFFQHDDKEYQLIATQFESHHAREVFPCIDEPEAKATFDLTLTTPADETVLANTPVKNQTKDGKLMTTTFETSPKMSTYLLAFAYGDLGYKESKTKDGVVVRTYATPDNVQFTDFALDVAVKTLEFYNDYFGTPYPLPKCDMVALPDFAAAAMENWGLITYREQVFFVDPKNTSLSTKQVVAMVIAHELAHQWFGNLVTMRWWTDLWLNEGFASWIEYLAIDHLFPEWDMWTQFIVDEQQRAFKLDALEHTHPVEVPVHHPDEIRTIFDTISYSKGASVIHMLNQYLTPDVFRDGLRHYLNKHAYGNTDTVDLWDSLAEVSGKEVKAFMNAWTSQSGFPLLEVSSGNESEGALRLTQSRFFINPAARARHYQDNQLWPIPLLLNQDLGIETLETKDASVGQGGSLPAWLYTQLHSDKLTFERIMGEKSQEILIANKGSAGFYLTSYNSQAQFTAITDSIRKNRVTPLDRLKLLYDTFLLAKAGHFRTDTKKALTLLEAYEDEANNAVWDVIAGSISSVRGTMHDEELRELMKPFIRRITARQVARLGWEPKKGESHFDQLLRPTVLGLASSADEPSVIKECLSRFKAMQKPEDVEPDLRGIVYGTAVRHGDEKTFAKLLKMHEASANSEERTTIAAALTGFEQPAIIKKALGLIKSESVRLQDVSYWVAYSFMNRHARDATWKWMTSEWGWLEKNLGNDMAFPRFPLYAANAYSDSTFLKKFQDFFTPRNSPTMNRSIKQGIEVIEWQSAWKARDLDEIKAFFKDRQ